MNTGKPTDSDLQQDLDHIEARYRDLPADEPPAMLDQAILNKARLATEKHAVRPWTFGWVHATATAALLVIGLTLVLQQRSEIPTAPMETGLGVPLGDSRAASQSPAYRENSRDVGDDSAREDVSAYLERPELLDRDEPGTGTKAEQAFNEPSLDAIAKSRVVSDTEPRSETEARQRSQEPASTPAPVTIESPVQLSIERPARPSEQPQRQKRDLAEDQPVTQPVAPSGARAIDSGLRATSEEMEMQNLAVTGELSSIDAMEEDLAAEALPADAWLILISDMKASGDPLWVEELEAFRALYPDHPLPEALQAAEETPAAPDDG